MSRSAGQRGCFAINLSKFFRRAGNPNRRKARNAFKSFLESPKKICGCPFLWFVSFGQAKEMNIVDLDEQKNQTIASLRQITPHAARREPFPKEAFLPCHVRVN